jgi:hypothetical protein
VRADVVNVNVIWKIILSSSIIKSVNLRPMLSLSQPVPVVLDPAMILQQAVMDVGLPVAGAVNQPLVEVPPLIDQVLRGANVNNIACFICLVLPKPID